MTDHAKTGDKPAPSERDSEAATNEPRRRDFYLSRDTHAVEPLDHVREVGP